MRTAPCGESTALARTSRSAHFDDLAGPLREWLSEHATAGGGLPPGRMAEAFQIAHVD
ncbi:hypothetical protein [Streptomyces sp. QHH-9511]|uniref:hypothetical protein n=1 Tax=Streptomyces sp. QHH-9511 TaxID=2684468 RepID=UPI001E45786A|nr:hypothetical protein [Streptomyces sp. QHH-9511]